MPKDDELSSELQNRLNQVPKENRIFADQLMTEMKRSHEVLSEPIKSQVNLIVAEALLNPTKENLINSTRSLESIRVRILFKDFKDIFYSVNQAVKKSLDKDIKDTFHNPSNTFRKSSDEDNGEINKIFEKVVIKREADLKHQLQTLYNKAPNKVILPSLSQELTAAIPVEIGEIKINKFDPDQTLILTQTLEDLEPNKVTLPHLSQKSLGKKLTIKNSLSPSESVEDLEQNKVTLPHLGSVDLTSTMNLVRR